MPENHYQDTPVLIIAQSARFLTQSAAQAGFTVLAADCFGDTDTLNASSKWQALPSFNKLSEADLLDIINTLSEGKKSYLVYGSGIEQLYPILDKLPQNIRLLGNSSSTFSQLKTPVTFFNLLKKLSINYPTTLFEDTKINHNKQWLRKSAVGFGGSHIEYFKAQSIASHHYLQEEIVGISGSALFLATKNTVHVLSINKQHNNISPQNFQFKGIEKPFHLDQHLLIELTKSINTLTTATNLVGINSIDFIISETNQLYILEINPRPCASMELIDSTKPVFILHLLACLGKLTPTDIELNNQPTSLQYLYSNSDITIPKNLDWPDSCHDLPPPNTFISADEPICTSLVNNSGKQAELLHQLNYEHILKQID